MIVNDLPNGKSSGFDGPNSESLKHADPLVCLFLSICFTCMFTHCYMLSFMIKSIIMSLVKNKCGIVWPIRITLDPLHYLANHQKSLNMSYCFALKTIYCVGLEGIHSFPTHFIQLIIIR